MAPPISAAATSYSAEDRHRGGHEDRAHDRGVDQDPGRERGKAVPQDTDRTTEVTGMATTSRARFRWTARLAR
jgi:hypothetical protein